MELKCGETSERYIYLLCINTYVNHQNEYFDFDVKFVL